MADSTSTNPAQQRARAMAGVQAVFERYFLLAAQAPQRNGEPDLFDYDCMKNVEIVDAAMDGSVTFSFVVTQRYANLNGVAHGGAYGVLFDMFTTTAMGPLAKHGFYEFYGGVTRSLNISYLKAVPVGTTVLFRSKVQGIGKKMALIHGEMTSPDGKILYATVDHHKVNTPMLKEHAAARIPWDSMVEEEERQRRAKAGSKL